MYKQFIAVLISLNLIFAKLVLQLNSDSPKGLSLSQYMIKLFGLLCNIFYTSLLCYKYIIFINVRNYKKYCPFSGKVTEEKVKPQIENINLEEEKSVL